MLTIVEHKIRNLEKRKTKLDVYRDLEKKGEKLTPDQKHACKKYEEVIHSLDLAKELNKQFAQLVKEANREAKRESKRNAFLRVQQESAKIREVLVIQDILRSLADDAVRQDFLDGSNGAVKIEQSDMDLLEKLYVEVTPKRPTRSDEPTFTQTATHSANTFSSVIDSRPKPFGESTYEHVKETLQSIQNCGYFEKEIIQVETKQVEVEPESVSETGGADEEKTSEADVNPDAVEAPGASALPQPETLIMQMTNQQQASVVVQQVPNANVLPSVPLAANAPVPVLPVTTVRAVEQNYYKQYIHPQPQPTLRPIHEVIGTGNFHFLQESELDSSDMIMATGPYPQALPPHPSPQQQKLGATPILSNSTPHGENVVAPIISGIVQSQQPTHQQQTAPQVNQISLTGGAQPTQSPFPNTGTFPSMAPQATMFNSNVLSKSADQPHIPPFTNVNSPQIPMQVPVGSSQIPGFAMNQAPQNAMAQIAQLQSMIQQQQLGGSIKVNQTVKQELNADDLTEKLKSTLHINDNNVSPKPCTNGNNSGSSPINEIVLKSSQSPLTNHHHSDSQDWNDVNNDANSWSNQMAEESNRNERYKRNSGNNNIGGMFRASSDKYGGTAGGNGNTYRPRNTYQNGNRGMQSNNGGDNSSPSVFFRNNDRFYQNGNKDNSYGKTTGNGNNIGTYNNKTSRTDMMNNRPPRMQSGAPGGDYRPRPGQGSNGRGGLKA